MPRPLDAVQGVVHSGKPGIRGRMACKGTKAGARLLSPRISADPAYQIPETWQTSEVQKEHRGSQVSPPVWLPIQKLIWAGGANYFHMQEQIQNMSTEVPANMRDSCVHPLSLSLSLSVCLSLSPSLSVSLFLLLGSLLSSSSFSPRARLGLAQSGSLLVTIPRVKPTCEEKSQLCGKS